jgi:hypothetical protein
VRNVIGLLAAAVAGTSVSGIGGAFIYRLLRGPSAAILETWQHWFASDAIGIIAVAPLVIGCVSVVRRPSSRSEVIEGALALAALAVMTGLIIPLHHEPWDDLFLSLGCFQFCCGSPLAVDRLFPRRARSWFPWRSSGRQSWA